MLPLSAVTLFSVRTVSVEPAPFTTKLPPRRVTAFVGAMRIGEGAPEGLCPKLFQFSVP